ncbi:hydroxymyristoyl-ACP dehydratase [Lysinibacillus fusiformis]|uniref:hydroxymyristoyl-ACP dehydratase n=1 Tax=Lysinibacillus fusiformis TaxID=28031 RepID=UPI001F4DE88E|nr:hydroxymyristoyl-ACP dehydratase [Lysinibacillus fusiformis]MCK1988036.1 hydroxymyristoyl-ACP dehydratase [Lysinibacillus fusiformis]
MRVAIVECNEKRLRPEEALDNDFCDRFVQKMHKQILHKKLHQQQYTTQELRFIIHMLRRQAEEIMRLKPIFITLSGVILSVFTLIAAAVNSQLMMGHSLVQIVALAILSLNVTILFISYKIEKEHKRVQAVIALVD